MSHKARWGRKKPPPGYDYIEPTLTILENELREKMNEPHEGKRKVESLWPIHQINWQRSRYVYDMFYVHKKIERCVYDFCIKNKIVDANLIAKWKKPGYERLCSTYCINTKNFNHGTVSICRVPRQSLAADQVIEDQHCGCKGCSSGAGGYRNIFGNKYGQYLAAVQIAREKKAEQAKALEEEQEAEAAQETLAEGDAAGEKAAEEGGAESESSNKRDGDDAEGDQSAKKARTE